MSAGGLHEGGNPASQHRWGGLSGMDGHRVTTADDHTLTLLPNPGLQEAPVCLDLVPD